jgi:protein SCO1/2
MNPKLARSLAAITTTLILNTGCSPQQPTTPTPTQNYTVTGVVQRIQPDGKTAIIQHDLIPNYMMAMTMPFSAQDTQTLSRIYPGDQITFTLHVTASDAWISNVMKTGRSFATQKNPPAPGELAFPEELSTGDPIPDCTLTNELGQAFQLHDLLGQPLALTFLFTRCPLPTYCPLLSDHFAETEKLLQSSTSHTNYHLLTISFDPEFDTPEKLLNYASRYRKDTNHWTFATGDRTTVEQLGRQLGLLLFRETGTISHNLRTVVVKPNGTIHHVFRDNQWSPKDLTNALIQARN